jgi:hypothetical protein
MSVTNKIIRDLEEAAVEAVRTMNDMAELLESAGMSVRAELLRLRAAELDLAETACSRERTLTMSEDEMREEFEALGLDWDETTERGRETLQRLLAEHDARREAEIAEQAGDLAAGLGVDPIDAADKIQACSGVDLGGGHPRSGFRLPDTPAEPQLRLTVLDVPPDTSEPMRVVRLDEQPTQVSTPEGMQLLASLEREERLREQLEHVKRKLDTALSRAFVAERRLSGAGAIARHVVRLADADITRLLADQIAEEFGIERAELDFPRASLLRLPARLRAYAKPDTARGQMNEDQATVLAGFMASTPRLSPPVDPQLLDLPIGHQPGGLVDAGPKPIERYAEMVAAEGERSLHASIARTKLRQSADDPRAVAKLIAHDLIDGIEQPEDDEVMSEIELAHDRLGMLLDGPTTPSEARALLKANGWEETEPGEWSPAPHLGWAIDLNRELRLRNGPTCTNSPVCSPSILRALAILAEEAQS